VSVILSYGAVPEQAAIDQLTVISRMMFVDGNDQFILVDLLKDGFLKENEDFMIEFGKGGMTVNGKKLPGPVSARYLKMIGEVRGQHSDDPAGSMRGGGISMKEVLDTASRFRHREQYFPDTRGFRSIAGELTEDGIADSGASVTITCSKAGVFINGRILATPLEEVYKRQIIRLSGFRPGQDSGEFSITIAK
jgi:hypothetical protein